MNIEDLQNKVRQAIFPIAKINGNENRTFKIVLKVPLPFYYVYFLFIDLLKFKYYGVEDKVLWSIPMEYNGEEFLIQYGKFGLWILACDEKEQKETCNEIIELIKSGVKNWTFDKLLSLPKNEIWRN